MRLAVLSDIHDHIQGLRKMLPLLKAARPDLLLLCGDLTRASTLRHFSELKLPLYFCLGNCDDAHADELTQAADEAGWHAFGRQGQLSLDSLAIGFTHFPALAQNMAQSGAYDAVFYGHSHRAGASRLEVAGRACLLANPGEIQGRYGQISGLVFDSATQAVEWLRV